MYLIVQLTEFMEISVWLLIASAIIIRMEVAMGPLDTPELWHEVNIFKEPTNQHLTRAKWPLQDAIHVCDLD